MWDNIKYSYEQRNRTMVAYIENSRSCIRHGDQEMTISGIYVPLMFKHLLACWWRDW